MSANDILDVLNVQRDELTAPAKKKQKVSSADAGGRGSGLARELYSLLGPNTPPVNISSTGHGSRINHKMKPSPWTRVGFLASKRQRDENVQFYHWVKGSKELLELEEKKPYFYEKFNVKLDIPNLPDEETYNEYAKQINELVKKLNHERKARELERKKQEKLMIEAKKNESGVNKKQHDATNNDESSSGVKKEESSQTVDHKTEKEASAKEEKSGNNVSKAESKASDDNEKSKEDTATIKDDGKSSQTAQEEHQEDEHQEEEEEEFSYKETKYLFDLCNAFELKWPVIHDRYFFGTNRSQEDLKEHFYRVCTKILEGQENSNPATIESLKAYSKPRELERKTYLETLLRRTPAEIAEEESLVIEARRFELAAKKMLIERSNLLTLLDSPQTTQSIAQYQSSQGLTNLYNHLMIADKNQKKRQLQLQQRSHASGKQDPVPPPIPVAASSSFKKDRTFQTYLQQYLSGLLKQNQNNNSKSEPNAIQQLLMKRLTQKEEEAYGLHYHANERLNPGVILRSTQRLPGLQQKQSVLKAVNSLLQELDIPTAGGTSWKPGMPTRKTMAKYDELIKSVAALLEVKKGKDKLEAEIRLIKSQRGIQ
jgi:DNA methyltransferase 1-associated protein 1